MTKRFIAVILAIVMTACLAACENHSSDKAASTFSHADDTQSIASLLSELDLSDEGAYEVYTVEIRQSADDVSGEVDIAYPQIRGLADETMQEAYNQLFKADIEEYFDGKMRVDESDGESPVDFACEYEVTLKNADVLSMVFRCRRYIVGHSVYPLGYSYGFTVNLKTGETLIPAEAIDVEKAASGFASGESWKPAYADDEAHSFLDGFGEAYIRTILTDNQDTLRVSRDEEGNYVRRGNQLCRSYLEVFDEKVTPIVILETDHLDGFYRYVQFVD